MPAETPKMSRDVIDQTARQIYDKRRESGDHAANQQQIRDRIASAVERGEKRRKE